MEYSFRNKLSAGKFTLTVEVEPPKGTDVSESLRIIKEFKGRVDAVNITDSQASVMRLSSLALSVIAQSNGVEAIYQLTTRDRNRIALQSDLLGAWALGVKNILALTGDHTLLGDHPQAKPVFDLDSVQFIQAVKTLNEGRDFSGKPLNGRPDFFIGGVVNPFVKHQELEIIKMRKKVSAGAEFFQTQAVFDVEKFGKFIDRVRDLNTKILAGIVVLKSDRMARFLNEHIPGMYVPESIIKRMEQAKDKVRESLNICREIITQVKPLCQGVHIMPIGWQDKILPLLEI